MSWSRQGIAMVPEGRGVFARLTVLENLEMGAYHRNDKEGIKEDLQDMYTLFPRLEERRNQVAGTLSGGEQQMLATARALMSRPRFLLMDEPSMGLAPVLVEAIFRYIEDINQRRHDGSPGGTKRPHGFADRQPRLCAANR